MIEGHTPAYRGVQKFCVSHRNNFYGKPTMPYRPCWDAVTDYRSFYANTHGV